MTRRRTSAGVASRARAKTGIHPFNFERFAKPVDKVRYNTKTSREVSAMCMQVLWDFGPWYCSVGAPRRRPSRRERTEELKDYIAELKEALEGAEERLKELEK
jgi:hypothetical protein